MGGASDGLVSGGVVQAAREGRGEEIDSMSAKANYRTKTNMGAPSRHDREDGACRFFGH